MYVEYLEVVNFRNLQDTRIPFGPGIHWLVGRNGQGKTNCLEAIYFSLTTKSFRANLLNQLMRDAKGETRIHIQLCKGSQRWPVSVHIKPGLCLRFLGEELVKPIDLFKTAAAIAFTARSKLMVEGQPEDRRRFLDRMISYLDTNHIGLLSKYKKVQNQLKKELFTGKNFQVYQGFKKIAAPIAGQLVAKRIAFLEEILTSAQVVYQDVFEGDHKLFLSYRIKNLSKGGDFQQKYVDISAQELLHQRSMMGPHLDDLNIELQSTKARHFASSGQVRAIVLSLKIAVRNAYKEKFGLYPLLLLDDIDSELDSRRIDRLLGYLEGRGSTLVTTSNYATISGRPGDCFHQVESGCVALKRTC